MQTDGRLAAPLTAALKRACARVGGGGGIDDLLFLETWEAGLVPCPSVLLRIRQIRRANPTLAAEIRAELAGGGSSVRDEASARTGVATRSPPGGRGPVRAAPAGGRAASGGGAAGGR